MTVFYLQSKVENFLNGISSRKYDIFHFDALTFDLKGFKFFDKGIVGKIFSDALEGK